MATVLVTVQAVLLLVLSVFVVGLLRSHAQILGALERLGSQLDDGAGRAGPRTFRASARTRAAERPFVEVPAETVPVGADLDDGDEIEVHDLLGVTPAGDGVAIALRGTPQLTLLAFLSTGCSSCMEFWDAFAEPANADLIGRRSLVVLVTKGPESESPSKVAELAPPHLNVVMSTEVHEDYAVPGAPYFVLVDGDESRIVGQGAATSFEQLRTLLLEAMAQGGFRPGGQRSRRELLRGMRKAAAEAEAEAEDAGG